MKLVMQAATLAKALQSVAGVVAKRANIPILLNVHIECAGTGLVLTARNMDQQAQVTLAEGVVVALAGTVTSEAHVLLSIATRLPGGADVCLELVGAKLVLTSGRTRCELKTLPHDDWQMLEGPDETRVAGEVAFAAAALAEALTLVSHAMARDQTRPYISGVALECEGDEAFGPAGLVHVVATDGHRMAIAELPGEVWFKPVIIPHDAVAEIIKLCGAGADVSLSFWGKETPSLLALAAGEACYTTKLVDGAYPDWRRVVPTAFDAHVTFAPAVMIDALGLIAAPSDEKTPSVSVSYTGEGIGLRTNEPAAQASTLIAGECELSPGHTAVTSCVDARYFADALKALGKHPAAISLCDGPSPWLIISPDGKYRQVIMPVVSRVPAIEKMEDAA